MDVVMRMMLGAENLDCVWRDTLQSKHENWQGCERGEFKFILKFRLKNYQLHFI